MIHVVDYGLGNIRAICNMLTRLGIGASVSSHPEDLRGATRLILPGVGAFDVGMRRLRERGFEPVLRERVLEARVPTLGVCLGMQLLGRSSEEGETPGLAWVDAEAAHFRRLCASGGGASLRVPHMGWSYVDLRRRHALLSGLAAEARFYFAHSYVMRCRQPADELASSFYGEVRFASIIACGNIAGVQFHPEKSHRFGMQLLRNFSQWTGG